MSRWSAPVGEHRSVARLAIALAAVAVIVSPFASLQPGVSFPLFAMLLAATIMGTWIIALLLIVQARAMHSMPAGVLGAGFTYAAATMVPYALLARGMFPALGPAIGAEPAAHEYLWSFWQIGLLIAILAYQRLRFAENSTARLNARGKLVIVGLAAAYVLLTPLVIWLPGLPVLRQTGGAAPLFSWFMAPLVLILSAAVVIETVRRRRQASVLDAWVSMLAYAVIVEVYLSIAGGGRFSLGWYAARVITLFATSAVLTVLLAQATRLYAELIDRAELLESEAHTDTLTGLANRRRFDEEFKRAFGSAIRRSSPIAVAIIDIDHFKDYNDAFGHQAGDVALQRIASAIGESVARSGDFAARYGGEEFVVILEETTLGGAVAIGERVRNAVRDAGITTPAGEPLTVSVGVAARLPGSNREALLRQADAALYAAKNMGRNRVARWESSGSAPVGSAFDDPTLSQ